MNSNGIAQSVTDAQYDKCAKAYSDCYLRLKNTNDQLKETTKLLNEYKENETKINYNSFLKGCGVGAGTAAVIIIVTGLALGN